ncbi:hypothetical protein CFOL_v3_34264 [Cephalotus follicularis]|uniref:Metallophos domain-containing protein n=1 Tax=Cephalotus follicularis TaxID=3775 RepID=A0A1Q3DEJ1_CEPFO|nr:hypothetical protein CFOL_v3_34264 [Cephalotus follicularis]
MEKPSWLCTLATQLSLCFSLYLVLNLGQPQKSIYQDINGKVWPNDAYFITVRGGYRPIQQQTHLLKLMERVAKAYKAMFVVNISKLGEDDPLTKNAMRLFPSRRIPWYTTRSLKGMGVDCFLEQRKIHHGQTLDIIGVDTRSFQEIMLTGSSNGSNGSRLYLERVLEATNSDWRIVVGYEPMVVCEENKEQAEVKKAFEPLHQIFMKFGVNVYLSSQGCINFTRQGSVAYIGNPGLIEEDPYAASINLSSKFSREMVDGFLLHRVNWAEIATYFVTEDGEVVYKTVVHQRGKEVM